MKTQMGVYKSEDQLLQENEELRSRLAETEATLEAIRNGEVDAIVVSGPAGEKIFTLTSAETPYRIIIEEMDEGAVTVSEKGTILYCNRRFEELAATSTEQLVGSNFTDLLLPEDQSRFNILLEQGLSGRIKDEITTFNRSGEPVHLHLSMCILPEGMLGKICIIVTDITELKNHQQNLQQLVNERTSELERTNFELKEINTTKDKLFSIIAHDLRGPFTSLMGYSDLAIENIETFDKEKFEKILFHINSAARSAYTLLENLLIWARSKNGQLLFHPRELPLAEVIDGIIENLNSLAHIKNIRIINLCDRNIIAYGDENMINAIIRNLLTNAIKFCNKRGKIEISATQNEKFVEVRVKDNGIGMSEEVKSNLFLNKKRVTIAGTAHEKGTGLGLLICSEFVEKHKGNIWAESDMGNGSCFYFTLPNK